MHIFFYLRICKFVQFKILKKKNDKINTFQINECYMH